MMGEHGGRKKKAKKAKVQRDWTGCGVSFAVLCLIGLGIAIWWLNEQFHFLER